MQSTQRKGLVLVSTLAAMAAAFSSGHTEAQSAEMPLSELGCDKLNILRITQMNGKQQVFARECAAAEAAQAWEQSYGALDSESLIASVIYE
ncbi:MULTISPECIES: hypothetical protein [unclassified Neisseria]|uniref:hypothetical protein n=1 Tax=unclassified Neisseria TaxID=2623750 RepID=UPI001072BA4A|nr:MULTISPECIES: hypothetical protein [unclassified Neisseria]MBF0803595.1 hypothetical protein [Neisseria sp. 19428wB4_WF04]TFU43679.1 hypothetical protein E4T99_04395 [Neisseria sp. WF04]